MWAPCREEASSQHGAGGARPQTPEALHERLDELGLSLPDSRTPSAPLPSRKHPRPHCGLQCKLRAMTTSSWHHLIVHFIVQAHDVILAGSCARRRLLDTDVGDSAPSLTALSSSAADTSLPPSLLPGSRRQLLQAGCPTGGSRSGTPGCCLGPEGPDDDPEGEKVCGLVCSPADLLAGPVRLDSCASSWPCKAVCSLATAANTMSRPRGQTGPVPLLTARR